MPIFKCYYYSLTLLFAWVMKGRKGTIIYDILFVKDHLYTFISLYIHIFIFQSDILSFAFMNVAILVFNMLITNVCYCNFLNFEQYQVL